MLAPWVSAPARSMEERNHGEIRQEGSVEGQADDARAQEGHVAQRSLRQEGDEPQAGDRDRPFAGAGRRCEGTREEVVVEEVVGQTIVQEVVVQPEVQVTPGADALRLP